MDHQTAEPSEPVEPAEPAEPPELPELVVFHFVSQSHEIHIKFAFECQEK